MNVFQYVSKKNVLKVFYTTVIMLLSLALRVFPEARKVSQDSKDGHSLFLSTAYADDIGCGTCSSECMENCGAGGAGGAGGY